MPRSFAAEVASRAMSQLNSPLRFAVKMAVLPSAVTALLVLTPPVAQTTAARHGTAASAGPAVPHRPVRLIAGTPKGPASHP